MTNIGTIKYLTQDELTNLFRVIKSARDKAIFSVAYYHGLRSCEIGMLKTSDVDLERARIRIYRAKNSLGGEYPMRPDEVRVVKAWLKQRTDSLPYLFPSQRRTPISRRMLHYLIKTYGKKANIPEDKRHFHVLKHSIGTHLSAAGADLRFIQDWLGHKNIQNTVVYTQITNPARDKKAQELYDSPYIVKT